MFFNGKSIALIAATALLALRPVSAWICVGILEEDYCDQDCIRAYYLAALQDGNLVTEGGTGVGYDISNLCGTYFDGIGTLDCWGDIYGDCDQDVASLGGFTCRTRCDDDNDCTSNFYPQFGYDWDLPPSFVCA